jgi:hypothetical protein
MEIPLIISFRNCRALKYCILSCSPIFSLHSPISILLIILIMLFQTSSCIYTWGPFLTILYLLYYYHIIILLLYHIIIIILLLYYYIILLLSYYYIIIISYYYYHIIILLLYNIIIIILLYYYYYTVRSCLELFCVNFLLLFAKLNLIKR